MPAKKSVFSMFLVLLVVLMATSTASARPLGAALGTGFTYQGKLSDGGAPANGTYDLQFTLYDALSAGSQVGSTVSLGDVTVTDGLFMVQLDFGNVFDGTALYLEIGVRPGASVDAYITLTPRQSLTPTPYSIYSASAPWSGLTGLPAGFADGVDNGSTYQNIKIVAKSGGDFTTITAALNSISDASASNPYLVFVAPGVYSEQVTMKPYVDIQGAGEQATRITYTGSSNESTGTVVGANNAELRFLKVENTGGNTNAYAIYNQDSSPRLTHVTASASGGWNSSYGVVNNFGSPIMTDVTATASGGTDNCGVRNHYSSPTMTNLTATASGGIISYGVSNFGSSPKMTDVIAAASGAESNYGVYNITNSAPTMTNVTASATAGSYNIGLFNSINSLASPTISYSSFNASGGSSDNYGIYNYNGGGTSTVSMNNSQVSASDGSTAAYGIINRIASGTLTMSMNYSQVSASGSPDADGIFNTNVGPGVFSGTILINNSQITGSTNTILNAANYTTRVGASQLSGGPVSGGGTLTCTGVFNGNYTALSSTCQ